MAKRTTKAKPRGLSKKLVADVQRAKKETKGITNRTLGRRFGISADAVSDCLHDPARVVQKPKRVRAKIRNATPRGDADLLTPPREFFDWLDKRLSRMIGPNGYEADEAEATNDLTQELWRLVKATAGKIGGRRRERTHL